MGALSNYLENAEVDWLLRGQSYTPPATAYLGLIVATKGYWAASTTYAVGDYVLPTTPNGHMYQCTTAGTSSSTEPTWPTTDNGTVTDGTVVWTECNSILEAGTFTEVSGGSYARVAESASLTNWAGTQGAGTTAASSGTDGTTSNNNVATFPQATADWGLIFGFFIDDASTAGDELIWGTLTTPQQINSGATPSFAAGALTIQIDD